jgi:hypothetical protein
VDYPDLCVRDRRSSDLALESYLAPEAGKGQVIVHGQDGVIQEEFTYGDDPRDIPG